MNANPIRSILLHLDDSDRTGERVAVAAALAERCDAQVQALYAVTRSATPGLLAATEGSSLIEAPIRFDDERLRRARQRFDASQPGPRVVWDELTDAMVTTAFVRRALFADLLVLGQYDGAAAGGQGTPADFAESVIIDSGRPALMVPYAGTFPRLGERVLVAWTPTPQSVHALSAALPLLRQATQVRVVGWGEHDPQQLDPWLQRHGIRAQFHAEGPVPDEVGELLLSRAADFSSDLLVMGCYGHGRARERVLGGASRTVLSSMTLPVLMAH